MTFVQAIRTVLGKYAEFSGRAGRPEFWWWMLFWALVTAALNVFSVIPVSGTASLGSILTGLWSIAVLLPGIAVSVRRLRDIGYRWLTLLWVLVPIAGLVILIVLLAQPSQFSSDNE